MVGTGTAIVGAAFSAVAGASAMFWFTTRTTTKPQQKYPEIDLRPPESASTTHAPPPPQHPNSNNSNLNHNSVEQFKSQHIQRLAPWGLPSYEHVKMHDGFINGYDRKTRNPSWGCERLSRQQLSTSQASKAKRSDKFREDDSVPDLFRSKVSAYNKSGFDRGHLVPAADLVASQADMDDSFLLSNISPQVGKGFNRDYWARLERLIRTIASGHDDVYVTTGPLFIPTFDVESGSWELRHSFVGMDNNINNNSKTHGENLPEIAPGIAIPTHFFKIIAIKVPNPSQHRETDRQPQQNQVRGTKQSNPPSGIVTDKAPFSLMLACFVIPNEPIDADRPLVDFLTSVRYVEQWSGLTMFPHLRRDGVILNDEWVAPGKVLASTPQPNKLSALCEHVKCDLAEATWKMAKSKL